MFVSEVTWMYGGLRMVTTRGRQRNFTCSVCLRSYCHRTHLHRHQRYECGKDPQFQCPHCPHKSKLKENLNRHIHYKHPSMV